MLAASRIYDDPVYVRISFSLCSVHGVPRHKTHDGTVFAWSHGRSVFPGRLGRFVLRRLLLSNKSLCRLLAWVEIRMLGPALGLSVAHIRPVITFGAVGAFLASFGK